MSISEGHYKIQCDAPGCIARAAFPYTVASISARMSLWSNRNWGYVTDSDGERDLCGLHYLDWKRRRGLRSPN